jgi:hypothetical protein
LRCWSERGKTKYGTDVAKAAKAKEARRNSPAGKLCRLEQMARARPIGPEADAGIRLGAEALERARIRTMAEFRKAIDDPDHPGHIAAMELAVSRMLPMTSVNAAGLRMARNGHAGGEGDPLFVLNVHQTQGPGE